MLPPTTPLDDSPGLTPADGTIVITDPRTGALVGAIEPAGQQEVAAAVDRARAAAPGWAATAPARRGTALHGIAAVLREHEAELADLNQRETGKPFTQALEGIRAGVSTLEQYAELGPLHTGRALRGAVTSVDYTIAEPRGVVAVITPWNDPVAVAAGLLGAAVVTGNTVVFKPSERCPHLGRRLGELVAGALPEDVVVTVDGDADTGAALVAHPDIAMVAHVGSTAAGERIARAAALTGAHVVRENGGNDALIVDAGVDPVWAAEQAAVGAFANTGQICTSVERVYVHQDVADDFLAALVKEAQARTGSPSFGPLVDETLRRSVHAQVQEAIDDGAEALTGATVPEGAGSWYPATVLTACRPSMTIMREETFGPVAPVQVVRDFDEALSLAARGRYGLAATVLSTDLSHIQRAVTGLDVGTVKVNAVFGGAPGGSAEPRRSSGSGFGYGPGLLDEMTLTKVVHIEAAP
ncbi:succinate-semialdehyde dehydrogenase [Cnuibacter physcomitrellae]|uniref:aldehyde dehydrogenase family protein n=1 Tax=Cnuibacter physcomitrellae TaxID=1619308 RepID=UPI0012F4D8CC|nr:aldehyde dehydrogenase family protein [Cnuibacter physcomitrellae]GGI37822.1 succinate-semialdehyde dehydrogenase [Cnuibacter physcomitrellae]